jgi:non-reducing end alpha-L-arabinofuranosidase
MNRKNVVISALLSLVLGALGVVACGEYPVASLLPLVGAGGSTAMGSGGSGGGAAPGSGGNANLPPNTATLPCKVLGDAGHECVSAHSTVRVIVPDYSGPLYQVDTGTAKLDIMSVDGYADAAAQVQFCTGSQCIISIIYDQSGYGNHLTPAPKGSAKQTPGLPVPADWLPVQINGRSVYGIRIKPKYGYRAACNECPYPDPSDIPQGVPVGDEPQTQYMISSQHDLAHACCFDYGNAEITANNDGNGTMEAVYVGMGAVWGSGVGTGPWVMADMENGLYPGWENNSWDNISTATSVTFDFISAVVVGDTADKNGGKGRFAVYGGDAQTTSIKEMYDGIRPEKNGYVPMQKQGSVILGIGGDNSNGAGGRFYEGVIALGAASKDVVNALQVAISEAKYGL